MLNKGVCEKIRGAGECKDESNVESVRTKL